MRSATTRRTMVVRALYANAMLGLALLVAPASAQDAQDYVSYAPAAGPAAGEDDRYFALANELRRRILEQASWADLGGGECREGALRLFSTDSATARNSTTDALIARLERIIVARGIDVPLDSAPVASLLQTAIGWESGITRPKWDVPEGQEAPETIAAGLTGEFFNPVTSQCELMAPFDTMRIVVPEGATATPPMKLDANDPLMLIDSGPEGLRRFRDEFFTLSQGNPNAVLTYVHVLAVVEWRGFGVVSVNRPAERQGALLNKEGAGGATYLFHRVGDEWRVLAIARTW